MGLGLSSVGFAIHLYTVAPNQQFLMKSVAYNQQFC